MKGTAPHFFLPTNEEGDQKSVSMCVGRGAIIFLEEGGDIGADSERYVNGAVNRQQAMNVLEMEEWTKVRRKKKYEVARPDDTLVVRARVI